MQIKSLFIARFYAAELPHTEVKSPDAMILTPLDAHTYKSRHPSNGFTLTRQKCSRERLARRWLTSPHVSTAALMQALAAMAAYGPMYGSSPPLPSPPLMAALRVCVTAVSGVRFSFAHAPLKLGPLPSLPSLHSSDQDRDRAFRLSERTQCAASGVFERGTVICSQSLLLCPQLRSIHYRDLTAR